MAHLVRLTFNIATTKVRERTLQGRKYIVANAVMMTPGVHTGSKGPIYYSDEQLEKAVPAWNHKPLTYEHPPGDKSASDTGVIESQTIGKVLNAAWKDGKQKFEAWFDKDLTQKIAPGILKRVMSGQKVEVSTGLFMDYVRSPGVYNGDRYQIEGVNHRPDHLAVLAKDKGACSIEKGAGIHANASPKGLLTAAYNRYFSAKKRDKMKSKDFGDPRRKAFPIEDQEDLKNAARLIGHAKNPAAVKARLKRIAKSKGLKVPKSWKDGGGKTNNLLSSEPLVAYRRVESKVKAALKERHKAANGKASYYSGHIEDVYPSHVIVGRHDWDSGDVTYQKQDYRITGPTGKAELVGAPEDVHKIIEYRSATDGSMCGNSNPGGSGMAFDKTKTIDHLIKNGGYGEKDRASLERTPDRVLRRMGKMATNAATPAPGPVTNAAAPVAAQPPVPPANLEAWLTSVNAPAFVQQALRPVINQSVARHAELVAALETTKVYNKEQLQGLTLEVLEGMYKLYTTGQGAAAQNRGQSTTIPVPLFHGAATPPPAGAGVTNQDGTKPEKKAAVLMPLKFPTTNREERDRNRPVDSDRAKTRR